MVLLEIKTIIWIKIFIYKILFSLFSTCTGCFDWFFYTFKCVGTFDEDFVYI